MKYLNLKHTRQKQAARGTGGEILWPATVLLAWGALQVWQAFAH